MQHIKSPDYPTIKVGSVLKGRMLLLRLFALLIFVSAPAFANIRQKLFCEEILKAALTPQDLKQVPFKGAPGLFVSQDFMTSFSNGVDPETERELEMSARYAKVIEEKSQEHLLLLPNFRGTTVPGFDGVIFDQNNNPVANYSLKTCMNTHAGSHCKTAIEKAAQYSRKEDWLPWSPNSPFGLVSTIKEHKAEALLSKAKDWLPAIWNLLGIGDSSRKTRVVIAVTDYEKTLESEPALFDSLQTRVKKSRGKIESVSLILGNDMFEIRADGFDYFEASVSLKPIHHQ